MKVQETTTGELKTASAPHLHNEQQQQPQQQFGAAGHVQYNSMYPVVPVYLTSSNNPQQLMQHQGQPLMFVNSMPPQQYPQPFYQNMYPINSGHVNTTPNNVNQTTTTINQVPVEEEKPYFVHELNRHTDTLLKLALRYHCTEEDIKMLNSLLCDDLDLYEGKSLLIPKCDPSLIKKNYDLDETKMQTERQRQVMVSTFSKNNNITIDEAKVYLEMNDWNSKQAQNELHQDQNWEKSSLGSVMTPSNYKQPTTKTYYASSSSSAVTHRSKPKQGDAHPQYGFELLNYER